MQSDLSTYLQDHIAGANAATEVIALLREHSGEFALTNLLSWLGPEVQQDKRTLEEFAKSVAYGSSSVKDTAAWMGARLVSLKTHAGRSPFGAFEALEFLSLGIQSKLHLWRALERSAICKEALNKPDFRLLIHRAEGQHRRVEDLRLALAVVAL